MLHIELRRWADVIVIAPMSANTLAKAANGLCDNLLTCVVRAWDWQKPLLVRGLSSTMIQPRSQPLNLSSLLTFTHYRVWTLNVT